MDYSKYWVEQTAFFEIMWFKNLLWLTFEYSNMILYEIKGHALICFGLNISAKQTEHFSLRFSIFYVLPRDVTFRFWVSRTKKTEITKISSTTGNILFNIVKRNSLREKCPNTEFFLVHIFLYSDWIFSPNKGKYEPEKTPHLDTLHTVEHKKPIFIIFLKHSPSILPHRCIQNSAKHLRWSYLQLAVNSFHKELQLRCLIEFDWICFCILWQIINNRRDV